MSKKPIKHKKPIYLVGNELWLIFITTNDMRRFYCNHQVKFGIFKIKEKFNRIIIPKFMVEEMENNKLYKAIKKRLINKIGTGHIEIIE
jgi:hypothetical protein